MRPHELVLANNSTYEGSAESHAVDSPGLAIKQVNDASTGSGILSLIKSIIGHTLTLRTLTGATLVGPNNNEINVFPVGGIIMWSGTLANVPAGWYLCDGTNGTPDLREKFILGWKDGVDPGDTGGSTQHKHDIGTIAVANNSAGTPTGTISNNGAHVHTYVQGSNSAAANFLAPDLTATGRAAAGTTDSNGAHDHTFTGDAMTDHGHTISGKTADAEDGAGSTTSEDIYPPFYKLAFIMKAA